MAEEKSPNNTLKSVESTVNSAAGKVMAKASQAVGNAIAPVIGGIVGGAVGDWIGKHATKIAKGVGAYLAAQAIAGLIITMTIFVLIAIFTAFAMFIINSGAYVVPAGDTITSIGTVGFGESIDCSIVKGPMPFPNTETDATASRSWEIVADLYQGFWCFWNRSPVHIATDEVLYSPSYPQHFDYPYYLANPSPNFSSGPSNILFWCTWLVVESYRETRGVDLPLTTLGSETMRQYFATNGTYLPSGSVTPNNISPGDVVFFRRPSGPSASHVAVVYSITQDYILIVQSNGPTKSATITFNENGVGLQNLSASGNASTIVLGVGSL